MEEVVGGAEGGATECGGRRKMSESAVLALIREQSTSRDESENSSSQRGAVQRESANASFPSLRIAQRNLTYSQPQCRIATATFRNAATACVLFTQRTAPIRSAATIFNQSINQFLGWPK